MCIFFRYITVSIIENTIFVNLCRRCIIFWWKTISSVGNTILVNLYKYFSMKKLKNTCTEVYILQVDNIFKCR